MLRAILGWGCSEGQRHYLRQLTASSSVAGLEGAVAVAGYCAAACEAAHCSIDVAAGRHVREQRACYTRRIVAHVYERRQVVCVAVYGCAVQRDVDVHEYVARLELIADVA